MDISSGDSKVQELLRIVVDATNVMLSDPPGASLLRRPRFATLVQCMQGSDSSTDSVAAALQQQEDAIDALRHASWEAIHTGAWHAVPPAWRNAYALAALLTAALHISQSCKSLRSQGCKSLCSRYRTEFAELLPQAPADAVGMHSQMSTQQADVRRSDSLSARSAPHVAPTRSATSSHQLQADTSITAPVDTVKVVESAARRLDVALMVAGPLLQPSLHRALATLLPPQSLEQQNNTAALRPEHERKPQAQSCRSASPAQAISSAAAHDDNTGAACGLDACSTAAAMQPEARTGLPLEVLQPQAAPGLMQFDERFFTPGKPTLLSGVLRAWPALQKWQDDDYLLSKLRGRTVPVEVGDTYLASGWSQRLVPFAHFWRACIGGGTAQAQAAALQCEECGAAVPKQANSSGTHKRRRSCECPINHAEAAPDAAEDATSAQERMYLAQHPLFEQVPALRADTMTPEYCALGEGEVRSVNAWLGPPGTVTPLHTDPHPNLLCQLRGTKYVRLYPPSETPRLYPHAEGLTTNSSRVDVRAWGAATAKTEFPDFEAARGYECALTAGAALFIPPGWWHYVEAVSASISVSFWWS